MLLSKVLVCNLESMFPRDKKVLREDIKIHHTMRIMPEDQNTGGFFIALLQKNAHVSLKKDENKTAAPNPEKEISEEEGKDGQKVKLNDGTSLPVTAGAENVPQTIKIEKKKGTDMQCQRWTTLHSLLSSLMLGQQ